MDRQNPHELLMRCGRCIFILSIGLTLACAEAPPAETSEPYEFTYDWFTSAVPVWTRVLAPYAGRPETHYLEVGVFEGRSAIWMLNNILTHPTSTLTGIDLFPGDLKERYLANLELSGVAHKAITITGRSQVELRNLKPDSYDIIYIDGGHTGDMVLADAVLSWDLLKVGGLLIFDDYRWKMEEYPAEVRPGVSIQAFITAYRNYLELVHLDYQAIVRKKEGPGLADPYLTILGDYAYAWEDRELRRREGPPGGSDPVPSVRGDGIRGRPHPGSGFGTQGPGPPSGPGVGPEVDDRRESLKRAILGLPASNQDPCLIIVPAGTNC